MQRNFPKLVTYQAIHKHFTSYPEAK